MNVRRVGREAFVLLFLIALVLGVFSQAASYDFISYDDVILIKQNTELYIWKSADVFLWAFRTFKTGDWQPLTWYTFILDYNLFGLDPHAYHRTNVVLHLLNVLLLFGVLRRMTGRFFCSALVAGFFAVHPQHVESVAWIAERKDVLSGFFWLLTMWAYVSYVRHKTKIRYAAVIFYYLLGILSKPTLVTLPIILLLLDGWPLERAEPFRKRLFEKFPLFGLAAFSCVMTLLAVMSPENRAIETLETYPLTWRTANAVVAYGTYLWKTIFPYAVYFYYPYPKTIVLWKVVLSSTALIAATLYCLKHRKQKPFLLVGWLWFVVTLIPVIGLIQVGGQSMADRYTYFAHMGLFMALVWGVDAMVGQSGRTLYARGVVVLSVMLIGVYAFLGWQQVKLWRNSVTLYEHSLKFEPRNYHIQEALCAVFYENQDYQKALEHCRQAMEADPGKGMVYWDFGRIHLKLKRYAEAERAFKKYLEILLPQRHQQGLDLELDTHGLTKTIDRLMGDLAGAAEKSDPYYELGNFWRRLRFYFLATDAYLESIRSDSRNLEAHMNLANVYFLRGKMALAEKHIKIAMAISPGDVRPHFNYAIFLAALRRAREARVQYQEVLQLDGSNSERIAKLKQIIE